jgi:hypothetical protein
MLALPAERLIIGHGAVIEKGCLEQLAQAWRSEGLEL